VVAQSLGMWWLSQGNVVAQSLGMWWLSQGDVVDQSRRCGGSVREYCGSVGTMQASDTSSSSG
jgi:hypothetical protein